MLTRKGLTLLEVLMAIFIMGIGMLSVLAMFPAAADMMGRAISNSQMAEGLTNAKAMEDGVDWISPALAGKILYLANPYVPNTHNWSTAQPIVDTPVFLMLDQWASINLAGTSFSNLPIQIGSINGAPSFTARQIAGRFFTCNSDVILSKYGVADFDDDYIYSKGDIEGKFTTSMFYIKPKPMSAPGYVKRYMLVFKDRSQALNVNDFAYLPVIGSVGNELQLNVPTNVSLKSRNWLLLTDLAMPALSNPGDVSFVEIRSVGENGLIELGSIPPFSPKSAYLLKDVARVAYTGS